jgi:hypothetical protein
MSTRTGKIARLPREVRDQLNRRLQDGEPHTRLVDWLNSLPEVQAVLKTDFEERPVSEQNLSEWKQGGYHDWAVQQEALEMIRQLSADTAELKQASAELLTDKLAAWLAARYVVVAKSITVSEESDGNDWRRLREFCSDLVALRKGDHSQERLKLEQERLQQLERELELKREDKVQAGLAAIEAEIDNNPRVRAAAKALRDVMMETK